MATVSIQEYAKAIEALEKAIDLTEANKAQPELHKLNRDGSIQRFEFCVELCLEGGRQRNGDHNN